MREHPARVTLIGNARATPVYTGRDVESSFEQSRHVALIGKAATGCHQLQRNSASAYHILGSVQPAFHEMRVRRATVTDLKLSNKIIDAGSGHFSEVGKADIFG